MYLENCVVRVTQHALRRYRQRLSSDGSKNEIITRIRQGIITKAWENNSDLIRQVMRHVSTGEHVVIVIDGDAAFLLCNDHEDDPYMTLLTCFRSGSWGPSAYGIRMGY